MKKISFGTLALASPLLLAACGDDTGEGGAGGSTPTTGASVSSGGTKASTGTTTTGTATSTATATATATGTATASGSSSTGGQPFVPPMPFSFHLSPTGPDQMQSVTAGAAGEFISAGYAAQTVDGARTVVLAKFTAMGPVAGFGTMGVVVTPLVFVGGSDEIDVTTQADGKILVSATVANAINPLDRDVAVARFNADGTLDDTFGGEGVAVLDLNTAIDNGSGMLTGFDAARSIAVGPDGSIFVHAAARNPELNMGNPRTDTDWVVVKLDSSGVVDDSFGDLGAFSLDIGQANATVRGLKVLADGTIIASGYANTPDVGSTQAVVYKLTAAGQLDSGFATGGVFHDVVLSIQTEVYNFAVHGNSIVTAGYGRNVGDTNDYVSLKFDATTGARDMMWGGVQGGAVVIDPSGMMLGSNARSAFGLPDGGTVIIGSTGPGNMPTQDAVMVVLDANGALHPAYLSGIHLFKLGADGNDQFWGGAVSGDQVAIVGYQGGGAMQTAAMNDDSHGIVFTIP